MPRATCLAHDIRSRLPIGSCKLRRMDGSRIWWWSHVAYLRGWTKIAKLLRGVNLLAFSADLAQEADIQPDIHLWHRGLGIVVNPNVRIGRDVSIGQRVTIAGTGIGGGPPMIIGDGVVIGAGATILTRRGVPIVIGANARIGAGAIVSFDVPAGATVRGPKSTIYPANDHES